MLNVFSAIFQAKDQCQALEKTVNDTKAKYKSVLNYFAADEKMASQDFFSTLSKFIQVCKINCRILLCYCKLLHRYRCS